MSAAPSSNTLLMRAALAEAARAGGRGEVPVGAVVATREGRIIAAAGNETRQCSDPTAHAEMLAIRRACAALGDERLVDCDLYVTLEPCAMCAGAISAARLRRLYFAADDPKSGGVEHGARVFNSPTCHHRPEIYGGLSEIPARALLEDFFAALRGNTK